MTEDDLLAWADYIARNRRARAHYEARPISTHNSAPTPCVHCLRNLTQRASGLCSECREEKR